MALRKRHSEPTEQCSRTLVLSETWIVRWENLTVAYSSVWPVLDVLGGRQGGENQCLVDDGYAMLLKAERRGEGGKEL